MSSESSSMVLQCQFTMKKACTNSFFREVLLEKKCWVNSTCAVSDAVNLHSGASSLLGQILGTNIFILWIAVV